MITCVRVCLVGFDLPYTYIEVGEHVLVLGSPQPEWSSFNWTDSLNTKTGLQRATMPSQARAIADSESESDKLATIHWPGPSPESLSLPVVWHWHWHWQYAAPPTNRPA